MRGRLAVAGVLGLFGALLAAVPGGGPVAAAGAGYEAAVLADAPVGYWQLGSGPPFADSVGLATMAGSAGVVGGQPPLVGTTSDGSASVGSASLLSIPTAGSGLGTLRSAEFTVEFWWQANAAAPRVGMQGFNAPFPGGWQVAVDAPSAKIQLQVIVHPDFPPVLVSVPVSDLVVGEPVYVAATVSAGELCLTVNGPSRLVCSPVGATPFYVSNVIEIGSDGGAGLIDEFAYYDRALSVAELSSHFDASVVQEPQTSSQLAELADELFVTTADTQAALDAGNARLERRDLATGVVTVLLSGIDVEVHDVTPTGSRVLVSVAGELQVFDTSTLSLVAVGLGAGAVPVSEPRLSDNGLFCALCGSRGLVPGEVGA